MTGESPRRIMKSRALRLLAALLCVCAGACALAPLSAQAQDLDQVTIRGRVTDENGAIVPGASVTAVLVETGVERTVTTDADGRFRLIELEPGVYTVRAEFTNFATEEKTDLATISGQNVELNFTLRPAGVVAEQTVVSEADTPDVDTTRTVVGGTVTTEEIESLPNQSRSPLDLIFTLGGVTEEPLSTRDLAEDSPAAGPTANTPEEAGSFSLSGGPAYSNNITIDGMDNNDDRSARERFQPRLHLPVAGLIPEALPAGRRQRIQLGAPVVLGDLPLPFDEAVAFEPPKRGEEGSGIDLEHSLADLFEPRTDPVSVHRLEPEGLENEHVERALDERTGPVAVIHRHPFR